MGSRLCQVNLILPRRADTGGEEEETLAFLDGRGKVALHVFTFTPLFILSTYKGGRCERCPAGEFSPEEPPLAHFSQGYCLLIIIQMFVGNDEMMWSSLCEGDPITLHPWKHRGVMTLKFSERRKSFQLYKFQS